MCGLIFIAGETPGPELQREVVDCLRHRGPDDAGNFNEDGVFIGHTRLTILDLSDAAHQPLHSPEGRFVLAYNGEIYNYVELRERLSGWDWRSTGDTEVLLAGLALHGADFVSDLRGMFAFTFWDRERRTLLAARDQLGIKPLYYAESPGRFACASELRALERVGVARAVDPAGVNDFLLTGSLQAPRTIYAGVRSLLPGHLLRYEGGVTTTVPYWELPTAEPAEGRSRAELVEALDAQLSESVRIQLRADVPVGTFLSGGIDSSLVASYAADHGTDIHTFSVGFEAKDRQRWDESELARSISAHLGAHHHHVDVSATEFDDAIESIVGGIDQPSVDGANTWFVARATADHVKVALSGQGGDELFAGYNVFRFMSRLQPHLDRLPAAPRLANRLGWAFLGAPGMAQSNWYLRALATLAAGGDPAMAVGSTRVLFSTRELGLPTPMPTGAFEGDRMNEVSRLLISGYLRDTLLRDADAMSMQHSLEVRVPIVDHRLVEFALSIPGSEKVSAGENKVLLRELARKRLPGEVLTQPKRGFSFPLPEWLKRPALSARVREGLAPDRVADAGLVAPALVERELRAFERGREWGADWLRANRLWALFVLHEWERQHPGGAPAAPVAEPAATTAS